MKRFPKWQAWSATLILILMPNSVLSATKAESFAAMPRFADLDISPGGRYIAARMNVDNEYRLMVFDISGEAFNGVYGFSESDVYKVSWFEWASEDRLIISIGFADERGRVDTQERRLFSVKIGDNEMIPLFRFRRGEVPEQIQDRVVSFLPDDPDHILVQYNTPHPSEPIVYKVDVTKTTRHKRVSGSRNNVRRWGADHDGNIRIGRGLRDDGEPILFFRLAGENKWLNFSHRVQQERVSFIPMGFATKPNELYVLSNHEFDPAALYTFDLTDDTFGDLMFRHPTVDISSVDIDRETGDLISVNFVDDELETHWFDVREIHQQVTALADGFVGRELSTYSISSDQKHAVLRLSGPNDAGQFLVYNHDNKDLKLMPPQYDDLSDEDLGITIATEYEARDGLSIPAFVTLPPGFTSLSDAKNLPFVIHPHGGPTSRDFLRFSFDVQFLASLGYGVLQMNFRGSSGYGTEFEDAGDKEWGQAMQDDITDGVKWLVAAGVADASRIAISGGSYGGYAALMGVVKTPELYQCAISFAGVFDLPDLIRREKQYIDGRYRTRFIGDLWRDRKMLAENSPARRAEDIQVPVLLMHGDKDTVVDVSQSKQMAKRLKKYDKEHQLIVFEGGSHHLSLYRNRLQYLQETERFLSLCIGSK